MEVQPLWFVFGPTLPSSLSHRCHRKVQISQGTVYISWTPGAFCLHACASFTHRKQLWYPLRNGTVLPTRGRPELATVSEIQSLAMRGKRETRAKPGWDMYLLKTEGEDRQSGLLYLLRLLFPQNHWGKTKSGHAHAVPE